MKITMLWDNVVIDPLDSGEKTTESGIIVPESVMDKKDIQFGRVVMSGPGSYSKMGLFITNGVYTADENGFPVFKRPFKEGELVFYGKPTSTPFMLENKMYVLIHSQDVIGVVEEEE